MIKLTRLDVTNLIDFDLEELYVYYPDWNKKKVQYLKKKLLKLQSEGKLDMESYPEKQDGLEKIRDILERSNIDPDTVQKVNKIHSGFYEVTTNQKKEDGTTEATTHINEVGGVDWIPQQTIGTESFITQAPPNIVKPARVKKTIVKELNAAVLADLHAGFRQYHDGSSDPTHDQRAIDVGLSIIRDNQPDEIILLGDNLDLPQLSRFPQELSLRDSLQASIDYMSSYLAKLRASAPNSRIIYIKGNHEDRFNKSVKNNNAAIYGIKQANMPESWGVVSIPYLLRFDELGVEWVDGYPGGRYWLNDRLAAIHGNIARQMGRTASSVISKEVNSVIFGHIHRFESAERTIIDKKVARTIGAYCFGTAGARVDGAVPGHNTTLDEDERIIPNYDNWQQGLGWVQYEKGDKPFNLIPIKINTFDDYVTIFNNRKYQ